MGDDTKSETKAKTASFGDHLTGNATEDGAKTENGEVVTETTTEESDDD
ncbi:MAG TPA: hypothetical protein VF782_00490 [Allosphingosinicella sp.]|jgi:hypothetical protein